jgi:hypothetical protein
MHAGGTLARTPPAITASRKPPHTSNCRASERGAPRAGGSGRCARSGHEEMLLLEANLLHHARRELSAATTCSGADEADRLDDGHLERAQRLT